MFRYTEKQIKEIKVALSNERDNVEMFKRLQAVYWRMTGVPLARVISESGFGRTKMCRICKRYSKEGLKGLRSKTESNGGHNRKLSKEEEAAALERLSKKAEGGQFVRMSALQAEFEKDTGVSYHPVTFYTIMERNNWRMVVPRSTHPKAADEVACDAAKKLTL